MGLLSAPDAAQAQGLPAWCSGQSRAFMQREEQPSVPPASLPDSLIVYSHHHAEYDLVPTCMLHSSFTDFVWGFVKLIQNTRI
ncbi:uncharacterized [Tachysurus ichikawai]